MEKVRTTLLIMMLMFSVSTAVVYAQSASVPPDKCTGVYVGKAVFAENTRIIARSEDQLRGAYNKLFGYYHYLKNRQEEDSSVLFSEYDRLSETVGSLCDEGSGKLPSRIENKYLSGIPKDRQDNLKKMGDFL